jgi:hypothetical protein
MSPSDLSQEEIARGRELIEQIEVGEAKQIAVEVWLMKFGPALLDAAERVRLLEQTLRSCRGYGCVARDPALVQNIDEVLDD